MTETIPTVVHSSLVVERATEMSPPPLSPFQARVSGNRDEAEQIALIAAQTADDRKGDQIVVVQVTAVSYLADYFVVVSGFSPVQVKAIARAIEDAVLERAGRSILRQEGLGEGRWILQDYGDVVVHIFMPQEREYYNLEAFWGHGEKIDWRSLIGNLD